MRTYGTDRGPVLARCCGLFQVYGVKLPGRPLLGEGKPENQNHAIVFTRGELLQAIDMNQDSYLEEAFKVVNLLQVCPRQICCLAEPFEGLLGLALQQQRALQRTDCTALQSTALHCTALYCSAAAQRS